jgi:hypothetical protein
MSEGANIGHGEAIWQMPCLSQEFERGPVVELAGRTLTLRYDYEEPTGEYAWEAMTFADVVAATFTARERCTEEQVRAYDKVIDVAPSPWLAGLGLGGAESGVRHLRIYFDGTGAFDVAAGGFQPPAPRPMDDAPD